MGGNFKENESGRGKKMIITITENLVTIDGEHSKINCKDITLNLLNNNIGIYIINCNFPVEIIPKIYTKGDFKKNEKIYL